MSLVNLKEGFLYERLPAGLIALDERALIQSVVGGYQDRLEDLRSYSKKFQLFFSPVGLPEAGPNVVFVDFTTDQGKIVTRSLDITTTTPAASDALLTWTASELGVSAERLANPRFGTDLLRFVDSNVIDYLATNIGAILYRSAVADQQPTVISDSGTFTAIQVAHQKLIETYFPRLKFKGTARSFEALGKLLGFDDVRMVPLWGRVSPRLPNDPGAPANDPDFSEVPEYYPQQVLDPFYDPLQQCDGPFFHWSGTAANGTAATNFYSQVVNGFQPWVKFEADAFGISSGTLTPASGGTYLLAGGASHFKASASLPSTGTFYALGEGESWNGVDVVITELDGTLRRLDISDRLSSIKYRTSFYNLGLTMDADKAEELFGTQAVRTNKDIALAPHTYISFVGTLYGTSPFRPFAGGTTALNSTTGVQTSDFLTPYAGTVVFYGERHEAGLSDSQENYADLAKAGQGVTQALEEVRAATRSPRRASYGYLQDDTVQYAPIAAHELLAHDAPWSSATVEGTFTEAPLPLYRTGLSVLNGTDVYFSNDTTDSREPQRINHNIAANGVGVSGFTVPSAGSYSFGFTNSNNNDSYAYVEYYGTIGENDYPDTHEVVRPDVSAGTQPGRYMPRPEDELDDDQLFETLDEYPYRRDILGGGEVIETDYLTSSGTAFAQYSLLDQTMAVKDQTEVDFDVFVAFDAFPVPQFVIRPKAQPYRPGQRAVCFNGQFRNQATLTPDDLDPFAVVGGRTAYFHSDLDNVFQPGYRLYHAGLVNGVLVADADKFNGPHHLSNLRGWLPLNEHPEAALTVRDAASSLAVQSLQGVASGDRVFDAEQGFSLTLQPGARLASTAFREAADDLTFSFWIKTNAASSAALEETVMDFGNVQVIMSWEPGPVIYVRAFLEEWGLPYTLGGGCPLTPGAWSYITFRKQWQQGWTGCGSVIAPAVESGLDLTPFGYHLGGSQDANTISFYGLTDAAYQVRDFRLWNAYKTTAALDLVRYHQPCSTVVPYRVGHVLSLNTGDRYGLQVLINGWLTPSNMPAWVRSPKFAAVVRYDSDGEYHGETYRKEVGLGGGQALPAPWKLGEQFSSLTADGTVVVSPQLGAMPGSNSYWQADTAPGFYIVLNGSTAQGSVASVVASGSGANPWPNRMEATNPVRETIWLQDSGGTALYSVRLEAAGTGAQFSASTAYESNQQQGDTASFLATPGYRLAMTSYGAVVQEVYSGTVTTPSLYMYLHDTLLEDVEGADTIQRWTDPSSFGISSGVPALQEVGQLSFTNSSTLLAGTYRLIVDLGNLGRVDDDFDGFRLDITVADTTFNQTMLSGFKGANFRGQEELNFTLDHDIVGGWILTFDWLNAFKNPARGQARQLAIYGYKLRRLETSLYEVTLPGGPGTVPALTRLAIVGEQYGTVPGSWLVEVNSYGTASVTQHEGTVYPANDTLRSRYPLANLLTGLTAERCEDVISSGTFCLPDVAPVAVLLSSALYGV